MTVADRCPAIPADIVAETRRKPVVSGTGAVEVAGRLINQVHAKNRALRRSILSYEACRK